MVALKKSQPVPVLARPVDSAAVNSYSSDASSPTSLADIRSALAAIPNEGSESLDYDSWRNIVFAIHHATGGGAEGLALAHEFSSRSDKYEPQFLDERVWPYVRDDREGAITARTLFNKAREHGWIEPVEFDDLDAVPAAGTIAPETGAPANADEFEDLDAQAAESVGTPPKGKMPETRLPPAPSKFAFVPDTAFISRPAPSWIVRGVLPDVELAAIIGQPGSGKSFLALDLAAAIARGVEWRGRRVRKGRVAYIAAEGAGGFRNRVLAYTQFHVVNEGIGLSILADAPNIMQKEDVRLLIQAAQRLSKLDVIFVDTFAQVTPGANENSGEDMGRALGHCRALRKHTGATVVLVHHVGKDEQRGARGWSGIKGAVDAEITVQRDQYGRKAVLSKLKDGIDGLEFPFRLKTVVIGEDEDGPIESCIVEHLDEAEHVSKREPKGTTQKLVWRVLHELVGLGEESVPLAAVIENAANHLPHDPQAKRDWRRRDITRAVEALQEAKFVAVEGGNVRVLGKAQEQ